MAPVTAALDQLQKVTHLRNAGQHVGAASKAARALPAFGLSYPITNYQAAWCAVQAHADRQWDGAPTTVPNGRRPTGATGGTPPPVAVSADRRGIEPIPSDAVPPSARRSNTRAKREGQPTGDTLGRWILGPGLNEVSRPAGVVSV